MIDFQEFPIWVNFLIFAGASGAIFYSGVRIAKVADRLADRLGLGEALTGAIFLGASTSLSGLVTSFTAAADGYAELAVSNAAGGIAAQTVFLTIADMAYKKANLEHAAASAENIMQGILLIGLLSIPLLAFSTPDFHIYGVHPASVFLLAAYLFGIRQVALTRQHPMWRPHWTPQTKKDTPDQAGLNASLNRLCIQLIVFASILSASGWLVARNAITISEQTGLSQTFVGGFFTAVSTSLPELVTAVAAVRQGALTLAVGDIMGGNAFDTLFLAVADVAYREGSIYHRIASEQVFIIALGILLTAVLLMGLVRREKWGIANIGFESFLIVALYLLALALLFLTG